jgi:hypothetical protein
MFLRKVTKANFRFSTQISAPNTRVTLYENYSFPKAKRQILSQRVLRIYYSRPFTTLLIPFLSKTTLKFINSPSLKFPSLR